MYPLLQQAATLPYQAMFIRRNACCITNQNQQQRWARKNAFCIANQNQKKQQQQRYAYSGRDQKQQQQQQRRRATDIVIDFGKYKGKMLGTLPSRYLKWMSEKFRVGDCAFEDWAILADQVLADPIYRDRIEWEFAQNVLEGNDRLISRQPEDPVAQLEDIRDRFGWDYFSNWRNVKHDLLGTSKGGRIPRLDDPPTPTLDKPSKPKRPSPTTSTSRTKRIERRQKLNMKLKTTDEPPQQQQQQQPPQQQQQQPPQQQLQQLKDESVPTPDIKQAANPFPGRQALLRKAIHHRAKS